MRLASPAVALDFPPITSIPPSDAPTQVGCDQGMTHLLSLLPISPEALQPVGGFPEQPCRCDWPSLLGHLQSLQKGVCKVRDRT